jgi:DNA-binding CsgD family transcriptional regulator
VVADPDGIDPSLLIRAEASLIGAGFGDLADRRLPERVARCVARVAAGDIDEPRMLAALALTGVATGLHADVIADLARRAMASPTLLEELWSAWAGAAFALVMSGHTAEAAAAEAGIAYARRRGSPTVFVAMSWCAARAAMAIGDLGTAAAHTQRALELLSEDHLPIRWILSTHVPGLIESGREAEARAATEYFELSAEDEGDATSVVAGAVRGLGRLATGDLQLGVAELGAAEARMVSAGPGLSPLLDWAHPTVRALLTLGRRGEAEGIAARELDASQTFGSARSWGIALMLRGMVDASDRRIELLREAVDTLDAAAAHLEQARALVELGIALLARGEVASARRTLGAGLDLADRCGAVALCQRARTELIAAGARPRRNALRGADALTPAERRTALMAAEALTNKQIAQALFVSVKTVEGQLAAAYSKLGVHRRGELARAIRRS